MNIKGAFSVGYYKPVASRGLRCLRNAGVKHEENASKRSKSMRYNHYRMQNAPDIALVVYRKRQSVRRDLGIWLKQRGHSPAYLIFAD